MATKLDPGHSAWTKLLKNVPILTQIGIEKWANECARIPRSQQRKGYSNFAENYIHDIEG